MLHKTCKGGRDRKKEENGVLNLLLEKDGKQGEHDPENSMATLINWWNIHPNYQKYRGKGNNGVKKIQICEKICENINKVSRCVRTPSSVKSKIIYIAQSWKRHTIGKMKQGKG